MAPITPKDPCLDPDYYDEDEDDLGDRLGQNAVLSLLGIFLLNIFYIRCNITFCCRIRKSIFFGLFYVYFFY